MIKDPNMSNDINLKLEDELKKAIENFNDDDFIEILAGGGPGPGCSECM